MKLYQYSSKIKKFRQNEKEIEELRKEYHKRCFELFDEAAGDKEKLEQIVKEEQISIGTIRKYALEYAIDVLGYTTKDWDKKYLKKDVVSIKAKIKQPMNKTKTNLCLLDIKNEESKEKIIKLIEEYGNVDLLKEYIVNFAVVNFPEEKDFLIKDLKRKINFYTDKQRKITKSKQEEQKQKLEKEKALLEQQEYKNNKALIEIFIKDKYESKHNFCEFNSIDINFFEKIVEYSKKYDINTYKQYEEVITEQKSNRFNKILALTKQMIYYIENGIEDECGIIRPFDIIDYHLYVGLNYELLRKMIHDKGLTVAELRILKPFFDKNRNSFNHKPGEIRQILEPTSIKIISGIRIEQETKELVIDFLRENKIPGNNSTYNIALRRYLNNTLQINEKINAKTKTLREIN